MKISIIAAVAENRAIGKDNQLLWHIKDDLKLFKRETLGHVILMGRKSFESIGKPLPKRTNVVITRSRDFREEGVQVFHSLSEALEHFRTEKLDDLFVLGGGEIYRQSIDTADVLHISHVHAKPEDADTFFPDVKWDEWEAVHEKSYAKNDGNDYAFTYKVYERKNA
jgi:dihydrofolate reductase